MLVRLLALLPLLGALAEPAESLAKPAKQKPKKPRVAQEESWAKAPSARYGNLDKTACHAELKSRKVAFTEVSAARGVLVPVRLKGPLAGVSWRTEAPERERAKSPLEVFDCRLVLALHDFSTILAKQGVEEVLIFSAWRPPEKSWPADKPATRHPGALAVDVRALVLASRDGEAKKRDLVVLRDWTPERDKPPCEGPAKPGTSEAKVLRSVFCEADEKRLFTVMLSPNYDKAHENHFHLEVTPGVKWRLVL